MCVYALMSLSGFKQAHLKSSSSLRSFATKENIKTEPVLTSIVWNDVETFSLFRCDPLNIHC